MSATETVIKMMDDFENKTGKPPTGLRLAPALYDQLKRELKAQVPTDVEISWIKLRGVLIEREYAPQPTPPESGGGK